MLGRVVMLPVTISGNWNHCRFLEVYSTFFSFGFSILCWLSGKKHISHLYTSPISHPPSSSGCSAALICKTPKLTCLTAKGLQSDLFILLDLRPFGAPCPLTRATLFGAFDTFCSETKQARQWSPLTKTIKTVAIHFECDWFKIHCFSVLTVSSLKYPTGFYPPLDFQF